MAHTWTTWISLCGLFCLSEHAFEKNKSSIGLECVIQSEGIDNSNTACANGQHTISCGNNTAIAITALTYGYKGAALGCKNATGICCTYDSTTDCLEFSTTDTTLMDALSGKSEGIVNIADAIANTTCTSDYESVSTFSRMSYQCIPGSRIIDMCVNIIYHSEAGLPVYIQNRGYRLGYSILATDTSCSVSVEVLSRSTNIQIYILHMQLSDTSTNCQQSITVSNENKIVKMFSCTTASFYPIQREILSGNYFLFNLTNTKATSGGRFWIGVEGASGSPPIVIFSPAVPRINCGALSNPVNSNVSTTDTHYGSVANYTCISGYEVTSGNISRICQENATWSGEPVICSYNCGNLTGPTNGFVTFTGTYPGHTATYGCDPDYVMEGGNMHRSCLDGSGWNGTALQCIYECGLLDNPQNGLVSYNASTAGSQATYICNSGFELNGTQTRNCVSGTGWNGSEPTCYATSATQPPNAECGLLDNPQNGRVFYNATTAGSQATYICNNGFELNGTQTRICVSGTGWNGSEPTCYATSATQPPNADCPELRSNSNIFVTTNGRGYNSVATYTCPVMYSPTGGDVTRVCQGDGTWSGSEPFCKIDLVMWIIIGVVAAVFLVVMTGIYIAYKVTANRRQQNKRHENQSGPHHNDNELENHTSRNTSDTNGNTHMPHFSLPRYTPDVSSGEYSGHMENIDEDENYAIIEEIDYLYIHQQDRKDREETCTRM